MAEPDLDEFYGNLRNYVRMVTRDYSNMLILDAKGGLGKTHTVLDVLADERPADQFVHRKGFSTPIELYKTLWQARGKDTVLFLDDMSGITSNTKAIDMLKAATDTQGEENWVEYRTSRDIDHPLVDGATLPNTFCFRGSVIMSFNDMPTNHHINALKDRGTYYNLSFDHQERLDLIHEIAKTPDFSNLSTSTQREVADWIEGVTNSSFDVTIRTFEEVCKIREFAETEGADWEELALDVFNLDHRKHRIIQLREDSTLTASQQVSIWCDEFDQSEATFYRLLSEIRDDRMN